MAGLPSRLALLAEMVQPGSGLIVDCGAERGALAAALGSRDPDGRLRILSSDRCLVRGTLPRPYLCCDGLRACAAGSVAQLVMAGFGELSMQQILARDEDRLVPQAQVLLAPHGRPGGLSRWLDAGGWHLQDERLGRSGQRFYKASRWQRAAAAAPPPPVDEWQEALAEIGPLLWQRREPLLAAWLADQAWRWRSAWARRERGGGPLQRYLWAVEQVAARLPAEGPMA